MTTYDPETGTRRLDVCEVDAASYAGDNARGTGILAVYISDDGEAGMCAEILHYVVTFDDGETFGVDSMSTIGRAICEDGLWRPDDSADIDYDYAGYLSYETEAEAQKECNRLGQLDLSFALNLRDPSVSTLYRPYPDLPEPLFAVN